MYPPVVSNVVALLLLFIYISGSSSQLGDLNPCQELQKSGLNGLLRIICVAFGTILGSLHWVSFMKIVSRPNSVTYLNWTPIFERWAVRSTSKYWHQKDMSIKEIGLQLKIC